jgi:hypothetical protein
MTIKMNQVYGIEPDLCIKNPALILDFGKDIILPQYFYDQLKHLQKGNYYEATEASNQILQSLQSIEGLDNILAFKTPQNGFIYFINQEISFNNTKFTEDEFDLKNPLHRYLLSLFIMAKSLETSVIFLINSSILIQKCNLLKFDFINIKDFANYSASWLNTDLLLSIQSHLQPIQATTQIQWTDEPEIVSNPTLNISWQDL